MKRYLNWQLLLGVSLLALSVLVYVIHYFIFRDVHHIFIYLIGDIAFVFIEVLMVTLIIHQVLNLREKRAIIEKLITINGIRVQFQDDSWFLVRASSNTPTLVILGESFGSRRRLYEMMDEVFARLKGFPEVGDFDQLMPPYEGED